MTQLARPDPARNRSGRDHIRLGPAPATTEPLPADRSGLLRAGRPVPGWAVGTALLAPVVLVGGWLIAGALQPASYSPMRQTMSVLAGHSGTDRWVMTAALRAPAQSWILSVYGCATVTVIFTGLSCWLLIAARDGGDDLGMVERLTSAVQSLFPLVVALALRRHTRTSRSARSPSVGMSTPSAPRSVDKGALHGRNVLAPWTRAERVPRRGPRGAACRAALGRYSSSVTSRRKRGAC